MILALKVSLWLLLKSRQNNTYGQLIVVRTPGNGKHEHDGIINNKGVDVGCQYLSKWPGTSCGLACLGCVVLSTTRKESTYTYVLVLFS